MCRECGRKKEQDFLSGVFNSRHRPGRRRCVRGVSDRYAVASRDIVYPVRGRKKEQDFLGEVFNSRRRPSCSLLLILGTSAEVKRIPQKLPQKFLRIPLEAALHHLLQCGVRPGFPGLKLPQKFLRIPLEAALHHLLQCGVRPGFPDRDGHEKSPGKFLTSRGSVDLRSGVRGRGRGPRGSSRRGRPGPPPRGLGPAHPRAARPGRAGRGQPRPRGPRPRRGS